MTTLDNILIPPRRGSYEPVEGLELRCYSEHQGMLTRPAWEHLGSPAAVGFTLDPTGYAIVAMELGKPGAIKLHQNRKVSLGVITSALKDAAFPLRITLVPDGARLRFGRVEA